MCLLLLEGPTEPEGSHLCFYLTTTDGVWSRGHLVKSKGFFSLLCSNNQRGGEEVGEKRRKGKGKILGQAISYLTLA
jgi:hypothetical protein